MFRFAQVVFAVRTTDPGDLAFLEALLARNPGLYRRHDPDTDPSENVTRWMQSYAAARLGRLHVKIDDDIVFIQVCCPVLHKHLSMCALLEAQDCCDAGTPALSQ